MRLKTRLNTPFPRKLKTHSKMITAVLVCVLAILELGNAAAAGPLNSFIQADAPVVDLNGPDTAGLGYAATFTEDEGPLVIVADDLSLTSDSGNIDSATISLQDKPDQSAEKLAADVSESAIHANYDAANGILNLSGTRPIQEYESVLRSVTYLNESQSPDTTDRIVEFVVRTGSSNSEAVNSVVAILATNDAPVLDNSGDMILDAIEEDDVTQIGNLVSTIIASAGGDRITDQDYPQGDGPEGMAVIEVGDSNGTWEYSIDSGSTWSSFGTVNNSSAVLLDETSRIRFIPNANYNGIAGFIFRAWDQTTVEQAGARADASINGGTSAFSVATEAVSIEVTAVNDRPVVDLNGQLPGESYTAGFLSTNQPVPLTTLDAFVFDAESTELTSLAITLTNRPDGAEESLAVQARAGITVTPYNPASGVLMLTGAASLNDYSATLRSLSYANSLEPLTPDSRIIEFVANDGTDTSLTRTATLIPYLSNTAPELDEAAAMQFTDINEDDTDPDGDSVSELLATAVPDPIHDIDEGALRGFAVVGADNTNGEWQFSIDSGSTWLNMGEVSDQAAVLLGEQARIRFLPEAEFSGETRSIVVRAWDQTEGANGASGVDAGAQGGDTAFSVETTSIPVMIKPVNDAPILSISANTIAQFTEGDDPVVVAGPTIQIIDVDGDMLQSATIAIKNVIANEPDELAAVTNGSGIAVTYNDSTGVLKLTGNAGIADYQSVLRRVTFYNRSDDPAVEDRIISFKVSDGVGTSNEVTSTVSVEAINDPPILDLNGEDSPGLNNSIDYDKDGTPGGGSVALASAAQITDVDNTTLIGATIFLENNPDGSAESLTIDTLDTNISVSAQQNGRELILTGQDSLAAYQKVMRTAEYSNNLPFPNRAVREISFTVQDSSLGTSTVTAEVLIQPQLVFMPMIGNHITQQLTEEPNDNCEEARSIFTNFTYEFMADDVNDWFSFTLSKQAVIRVELTEFTPKAGQLLVAQGTCGDLKRIGHNGDFSTTKTIQLGALASGRYYIWLINDGPTDNEKPYKLRVKVSN